MDKMVGFMGCKGHILGGVPMDAVRAIVGNIEAKDCGLAISKILHGMEGWLLEMEQDKGSCLQRTSSIREEHVCVESRLNTQAMKV